MGIGHSLTHVGDIHPYIHSHTHLRSPGPKGQRVVRKEKGRDKKEKVRGIKRALEGRERENECPVVSVSFLFLSWSLFNRIFSFFLTVLSPSPLLDPCSANHWLCVPACPTHPPLYGWMNTSSTRPSPIHPSPHASCAPHTHTPSHHLRFNIKRNAFVVNNMHTFICQCNWDTWCIKKFKTWTACTHRYIYLYIYNNDEVWFQDGRCGVGESTMEEGLVGKECLSSSTLQFL